MEDPSDNLIIEYQPAANRNLVQFSVLPIRIRLRNRDKIAKMGPVRVIIRTNLNQGPRIRRQIIDLIEKGQSYSTDYYDIPATYDAARQEYRADILLSQVGYFEFKIRAESSRRDRPWVKWADGPNVGISVRPLEYGRNNSVYCVFIRQFGPNKHLPCLRDEQMETSIQKLEHQGAYVLPPGGNFESFARELPFIINKLGMRIIHLLPINPVPTSYGRMGMYGSPYATTDYFGIDHTYGTFSRYKTIEDQFIDLTSTIHSLGAKIFLDMVINHTGWASTIHFIHRHWRKVGEDRRIISPGAWDVTWGDLVELDYRHQDLWQYMARVFLVWCRRGIDGFRLDAGYMVPLHVWQYIISKVRQEFPGTLFLLEGLGGPWETTENLLTEGQMNWAYSELFQNYTKKQIVDYLKYAQSVSAQKGVLVHYAETHDNDRLAKKGKIYTRLRLYISALTSFSGAWGFTNGVEWLADEKIDVHRNAGLNWGNSDNLVDEIARLNRILRDNPAFWSCENLQMVDLDDPDIFAFIRSDPAKSNIIACAINLNIEKSRSFKWNLSRTALPESLDNEIFLHDLLNEQTSKLNDDKTFTGQLEAAGCLLYELSNCPEWQQPKVPAVFDVEPDKITLIYRILLSRFKPHEVGRIDQEKLLPQVNDFRKFIVLVNTVGLDRLIKCNIKEALDEITPDQIERHSAIWTFRESSKEFIISGDKWLVVYTLAPCTAYLKTDERTISMDSIPGPDLVGYFSFFLPPRENQRAWLTFNWKIKRKQMLQRQWQEQEFPILTVPSGRKKPKTRRVYPIRLDKSSLKLDHFPTVLLTNGTGAFCQTPALPGSATSKYDSLFALTCDTRYPNDRLSLIKMVKETVQVGNKFFDLDESFLTRFTRFPEPLWEFVYDDGDHLLKIERSLVMPHGENSLYLRYKLRQANYPINLICKVYLECRSSHDQLKENEEIRRHYEQSSRILSDRPGMDFYPTFGLKLRLLAQHGQFISQPHWINNIEMAQDAERGIDSQTDIFSPGLFNFTLQKGQSQVILFTSDGRDRERISAARAASAQNSYRKKLLARIRPIPAAKDYLVKMLVAALDQFLVRGSDGYHLLAGLPWLGENVSDALHSVGGLLAAGRTDVARDLIIHAAQTEKDGLLTDWLNCGPEVRHNIESSLRLFSAAKSYVQYTEETSFYDRSVGAERPLRQVLINIYEQFRQPISPGPSLDTDSGLLYCPAAMTWMNTRNPQATPRAGFPIEIQALWYEALSVLAEIYPSYTEQAHELRKKIKQNFMNLYWNPQRGHLIDILLADEKLPAAQALPDTALRFNQLAAIHAGLIPPEQGRQSIDRLTRRLLIPAGIRSLSEEPLTVPLKIYDAAKTKLLADPRLPYRGQCIGNEATRRLAYHNGTAWLWAYPGFIEARASVFHFSDLAVKQALAFFEPLWEHLTEGGLGTFSEMKDGNFPHTPRGCYAHARTVAEALRVYLLLKYQQNQPHTSHDTNIIATPAEIQKA